jgi:hypothetical protein
VLELLSRLEKLAGHPLLDRLIRGRAWLGLVTFALIGIVTLQLALLKLNGGVGRALEREAVLQRQNASLSIENSEMAAADRVQTRATQLGMEFASSSALRFLTSNPGADLRRGASALNASLRPAGVAGEETARGAGGSGESGEHSGSEHSGGEHSGGETQSGEASAGAAAPASTQEGPAQAPASGGGEAAASQPQNESNSAASGSPPASPGGGTQAGPNG